jgi:hypothetical protein
LQDNLPFENLLVAGQLDVGGEDSREHRGLDAGEDGAGREVHLLALHAGVHLKIFNVIYKVPFYMTKLFTNIYFGQTFSHIHSKE